jgi:AcrR family transcriptional regulator
MQTRDEKKAQTRKSLMDAALSLTGNGSNFSSISLREVAKNAGVVPTSFYRHFTDMEELGLNIIDDLGLMLRKLMRTARQNEDYFDALAKSSVEFYANYVCTHKNYFYFMEQVKTGGTPTLRKAIRKELKYFANELVSDVRPLKNLANIDDADLDILCQLIVETVFENTIDLLDQAEVDPRYIETYTEHTLKKLRLIWLGAIAWRS